MPVIKRRDFISRSTAATATFLTLGSANPVEAASSGLRAAKDEISLAEWTLSREIQSGQLTNLDFPRLAREEFDIGAIEFVNTLFAVPTYGYLKQLQKIAGDFDVKMPVLMVDDEGDPVSPNRDERAQFVKNHRKWIDVASVLGCKVLRTNCRGSNDVSPDDAMKWAADTYSSLLEYAVPEKICIVIENHGGVSDDADWMVALIESVDNLYFGSYIDWRWRDPSVFDNLAFLQRLIPFARGLSYKRQPSEEHFRQMTNACREAGYRGFYAIEQKGFHEIRYAKRMFEKFLYGKDVPA